MFEDESGADGHVHYEGTPVAEREIDGVDYRVDAGRGSTVAVSQRPAGTYTWALVAEGRWDGTRLKVKGLEYPVLAQLGEALREASGRNAGEL